MNANLAFDRIAQRLTDASVDRARAATARGEEVAFGAVTVSLDGLATDAGRVLWATWSGWNRRRKRSGSTIGGLR